MPQQIVPVIRTLQEEVRWPLLAQRVAAWGPATTSRCCAKKNTFSHDLTGKESSLRELTQTRVGDTGFAAGTLDMQSMHLSMSCMSKNAHMGLALCPWAR